MHCVQVIILYCTVSLIDFLSFRGSNQLHCLGFIVKSQQPTATKPSFSDASLGPTVIIPSFSDTTQKPTASNPFMPDASQGPTVTTPSFSDTSQEPTTILSAFSGASQ